MKTITLTVTCPDRKGLIAGITNFIYENSGNIVKLNEFVDSEKDLFFIRVEWEQKGFKIPLEDIPREVGRLAKKLHFANDWELFYSHVKQRMAIFCSKYDHCLYDLLIRHKSGELDVDIHVIISNHSNLKYVADFFGIDFVHIYVHKNKRREAENKQRNILKKYKIDFIVLARYMQVLSEDFIKYYRNKMINIHHSFLPAFEGAKAYHQAHQRGVKVIGATAHYVTKEIDKGPIIRQDVIQVSHRDSVEELVIKGRDLERQVLADAVKKYLQHRVFVANGRTIIF
ncbi:formyltetrahydrofolate deformylase [Candidatus Woesearchaeota archaeon]|nr:formyltetrahydrofolate deformylase [Candidatus Woesearchaeota archaeon]